MDRRHPTLLPSLTEALETVKGRQTAGTTGLFEADILLDIPEIDDPHQVSHKHPFTPARDEDDDIILE